jgi:hypothetical protein
MLLKALRICSGNLFTYAAFPDRPLVALHDA